MSNLVSISQARAILPDLVERVNKNMDRVTITVNGKAKAIVLSAEELESIEETAEIMATLGGFSSIKQGEKDVRDGNFVSLDDLDK